jgi:ATP-binding cassette, subfamily B, bacterial
MGSVHDNIIYGNQGFDCSQKNVEHAAKIANAHDFIEHLPDKYYPNPRYNHYLSDRG